MRVGPFTTEQLEAQISACAAGCALGDIKAIQRYTRLMGEALKTMLQLDKLKGALQWA